MTAEPQPIPAGDTPWTGPQPGRRAVMLALAAVAMPGAAPARDAAMLPDNATILVAGPQGGEIDRWSEAIGRALAPAKVRREIVGGADGVTGANQFEARTAPDGGTVLLAPGAAATAWLVGDTRAQFDAARWVAVMAGVGSGVLVSRIVPRPGVLMRMAVSQVPGPELPGLLGLDLLGVAVQPVPGLTGTAAQEALLNGTVDALFVAGAGAAATVQMLAASGVPALFTLGTLDDDGHRARDVQFPNLPSFAELLARRQAPAGRLYTAWTALAAAAALDVALVLPRETPAGMVALWRRASLQVATSPELLSLASAQDVRPLTAALAALSTAAVAPNADALLELRRWLQDRHGWRPG